MLWHFLTHARDARTTTLTSISKQDAVCCELDHNTPSERRIRLTSITQPRKTHEPLIPTPSIATQEATHDNTHNQKHRNPQIRKPANPHLQKYAFTTRRTYDVTEIQIYASPHPQQPPITPQGCATPPPPHTQPSVTPQHRPKSSTFHTKSEIRPASQIRDMHHLKIVRSGTSFP
jgi:hypothetical protein